MEIERTTFGTITINGTTYEHDVIIRLSGFADIPLMAAVSSAFASGPFSEVTSCRGHVRIRSAAADHEGQVLKVPGADIASYE